MKKPKPLQVRWPVSRLGKRWKQLDKYNATGHDRSPAEGRTDSGLLPHELPMDRIADRETLAKAMGWKHRYDYDMENHWDWWVRPEDVNEENPEDEPSAIHHKCPDPFTDANDWMELAEWVRKQPWFMAIQIGNVGVAVDHGFPRIESAAEGPLLEALPTAVLAALKEMETTTDAK